MRGTADKRNVERKCCTMVGQAQGIHDEHNSKLLTSHSSPKLQHRVCLSMLYWPNEMSQNWNKTCYTSCMDKIITVVHHIETQREQAYGAQLLPLPRLFFCFGALMTAVGA